MDKIRVIAIFGESCSGKDTLVRKFLQANDNLAPIVHTTTRERRMGEINGVDYHFVDAYEYNEKVQSGDFISSIMYGNGTEYGTDFKELDPNKINIGAFSIGQVKDFLTDERIIVFPIYLYAKPEERLRRAVIRDGRNCHEICRRFLSEEIDYEYIPFDHLQIFSYSGSIMSQYGISEDVFNGINKFISRNSDFVDLRYDDDLNVGIWVIHDQCAK